ncbi:MAG: outer membrane protein assembly factor BamD [Polyangiaceae bacterium]
MRSLPDVRPPASTAPKTRQTGPRSLTRGIGVAFLVGSALFATPACTPARPAENPLEYTENARRAYEEALEAYFDKDWEQAVLLFEEIRRNYGYTRYARLAELRIADAAYHQDKYAEAIAGYKAFVSDYPNDPEVPYARLRIVKGLFAQTSDTFLLPPLEERDLANVSDAYVELNKFLADFPGHEDRQELDYMLEVVTGLLARHELYVARFYLREDRFEAAVARAQYALRNFEGSGLEAEAMVLLGETYLKMKKRKLAEASFRRVLQQYPASPFTLPARNFLKQMGLDPATAAVALPDPVPKAPAASEGPGMGEEEPGLEGAEPSIRN